MLTHNLLRPNLLTPNLRTHTHNNLYTHNFAWPALHLATATFTLRGRRGTYVTGLAIVARLGPLVAAAVCIAGVALGDSDLHFAWQAWHLATSTFTLRGRRGTWRYPFSFCVAGMYLSIGTFTLRGRHGTWLQRPSLCMAGGLGSFGRSDYLHGRRGTWRQRPLLCVAGVALMAVYWLWWHARVLWSPRLLGHSDLYFVWVFWPPRLFARQAGHLSISTFTLRGRRGAYGTGLVLVGRLGPLVTAVVCMAGVALMVLGCSGQFLWWIWATFWMVENRILQNLVDLGDGRRRTLDASDSFFMARWTW